MNAHLTPSLNVGHPHKNSLSKASRACELGDGPNHKRKRNNRNNLSGKTNLYMIDSGANINIMPASYNLQNARSNPSAEGVSSCVQDNIMNLDIIGNGTIHIVDANSNNTFDITFKEAYGGQQSAETGIAPSHGIISLVNLIDRDPNNKYMALEDGKTLGLRLKGDDSKMHDVRVAVQNGTLWFPTRATPTSYRKMTLNVQTRSKRKKNLTKRTVRIREEATDIPMEIRDDRKTITKNVVPEEDKTESKADASPKLMQTQQTETHSLPKSTSAKAPFSLTKALKAKIKSIVSRFKRGTKAKPNKVKPDITSDTGKPKKAEGINMQRYTGATTRRNPKIKVNGISSEQAHRWLMCRNDKIIERSVPSWLRCYIKRTPKDKREPCDACISGQTGPLQRKGTNVIDEPLAAGQILHCDFQANAVSALGGENCVLHLICLKTGMITSAYSISKKKIPTLNMLREAINKMIIMGAERPRIIYIDNDTSVNTKALPEWQALIGMSEACTFEVKPYPANSQSRNGLVERFHRDRNEMIRKACHRCNEPSDWLAMLLDRHIVDVWNHFIVRTGETKTPAELVKGSKSDPHHLHTFFAKAALRKVSRMVEHNHTKLDDTTIEAFYVGRDEVGAKFLDPVTANIVFKSSFDYKLTDDDLKVQREVMPPELERMRRFPESFPKISYDIPAKQNAYNQGKLNFEDLSRNEKRNHKAKEIRKDSKKRKADAKEAAKTLKSKIGQKRKSDIQPQPFQRKDAKDCDDEVAGSQSKLGYTVVASFYDDFENTPECIQTYTGTVTSFNEDENLYSITYADGDTEQIFPSEFERLNPSPPQSDISAKRKSLGDARIDNQTAAVNCLMRLAKVDDDKIKEQARKATRKMVNSMRTKPANNSKLYRQILISQRRKRDKQRKSKSHGNIQNAIAMLNQMIKLQNPVVNAMNASSASSIGQDPKHASELNEKDTSPSVATDEGESKYSTLDAEESPHFPIEFEIARTGEVDHEFDEMEHVFTLDIQDHDGTLKAVCNNSVRTNYSNKDSKGFNIGDTPKLSEVCDKDHPMFEMWMKGLLEELVGLEVNKILEFIPYDSLTSEERKHLLPSQVILKLKRSPDSDRTPIKAKARWVVGGHRAVRGYHHGESSAKGCDAATVRLMAATAAAQCRLLMATDITQAYTSAPLDPSNKNRIIIRLPKQLAFTDSRGQTVVALLKMNTYGLVDGGYQFQKFLDNHLLKMNFERSMNDRNLHRRFNEQGQIQLYSSYCDDGTGLFSSTDEYTKFSAELKEAPFKLGLEEVQTETLGTQIDQKGYRKPIGKPGQPGYMPGNTIHIAEGENTVTISQPGLISEVLDIANMNGTSQNGNIAWVKPTQVPLSPAISKQLDETIPSRKALMKSLKRIREASEKGKSYQDIIDESDPFAPCDDLDESEITLTEDERNEFDSLHTTFGVHYRTLVGKLLYLSRLTRPDISTAVSMLSRYNSQPGLWALRGMKHLCRYLRGTPTLGITYREPPPGAKLEVRYYSDSNYPIGAARLGYIAMLGWEDENGKFQGRAIDWHSRVSATTSNSTAEAELYAAYHAITRAMALRKDLEHIQIIPEGLPCRIFEDNSAVCSQFNSPLLDSKLKWINNKYLRVIELVASKDVTVEHVSGKANVSDTMTKGTIPYKEFIAYRKQIMGN